MLPDGFRPGRQKLVLEGLCYFAPHKVLKILRDYFRGLPQIKIAEKVTVDQSIVSLYTSRFKKRAAVVGMIVYGQNISIFETDDSQSIKMAKCLPTKDSTLFPFD